MNRRYLSALAVLPLVLSLLAVPVAHAQGGVISGNWVITQAAQQAQGNAPKVVACGTFTLTVGSTSPSAGLPNRGVYAGSLKFNTHYTTAAQPTLPGGSVQGAWMIQVLGPVTAVFVNFKGSDVVPAFGSFVSPAPQPHPSIDPISVGCAALANGFLGLLHLPGQGTEGATLYSDTPIDSKVFTG